MVPVLGNGPGLLNDRSLGREAGLSFHGRFSGHSGCGLPKMLAVRLEAGKGPCGPGGSRHKVMGGVGLGPGETVE